MPSPCGAALFISQKCNTSLGSDGEDGEGEKVKQAVHALGLLRRSQGQVWSQARATEGKLRTFTPLLNG